MNCVPHYRLVSAFAIACALQAGPSCATELVYTPINPSFGGNPNNAPGLLAQANAQNKFKAPVKSDLDAFNDNLQKAILSRLSSQALTNLFGKGSTAYNRYLGDADHQPNPCLGPVQTGPFYAVKVYAGDIGTAVGIRCNEHAQALDSQDQPIRGLYIAGNDMHSVMGGQYPAPGITLGPAMTFGWLAARHLAASSH